MRMSKVILIMITVLFYSLALIGSITVKGTGFTLFVLCGLYSAGVFVAKYLGHVAPQHLEEGVTYVFMGYDSSGKTAFLKHHIHIEGAVMLPGAQGGSTDGALFIHNQNGDIVHTVYEDYDETGIYRIDFKDPNISIGDKVRKHKIGSETGIVKVAA